MNTEPLFKAARPYQDDVLALPVEDLDQASQWYAKALGLTEVERRDGPVPTVIMQRDGVQIGFAINGGDASNDGAAILVTDIERARRELEASGLSVSNSRIDDHNGQKMSVFFLVAPDGLCYYFHQPVD
jgi:catechol 2,3-dioxygenase-like lactoylglutathione lyase family enzyme